jgi:hypothetical protein
MIPKDYSGGGVDPQVKSNFDKAFSDPQAAIKELATANNAGMVGAMVTGLLVTAVLDAPLLIATFPMVAGYLYGSTFPDDKVVEKEGQKYIKPGRSILQLVNEKQAAHEKKLTTKLNDLLRKLIPDAKVKESLQNYIELLIKKGKIDPKNSDPRCILQYLGIYQ